MKSWGHVPRDYPQPNLKLKLSSSTTSSKQGLHSHINWYTSIFIEIKFIWFKPEQYQIRKESGLPPKYFLSIKHHFSSTTGTNKPTPTVILKYNDSVLSPITLQKVRLELTLGITA